MSTEDSFVLKLNGVNEILTRKRQTHVCLPLILCRMLEETVLEKIAERTRVVANANIHNVMWVLFWPKGSGDDNFLSVLCYIVIITKPSKINFAVAFSDRPIYGPNPVKSNGDISSQNLKHSEYLLKTLLINQSKRNHELSSLTHRITSQIN